MSQDTAPAARDASLVAAFRAGDERAFDALHDYWAPRLERYAARVLGEQRRHAEDVVQEALLRAHRALLRDARPVHVGPWLRVLVRNCCLDELARSRSSDILVGESPLGGHAAGSDVVAERRERMASVVLAIKGLPPGQRHALVRRELDGVPHERLAAELGISVAASKGLVYRARASLASARP